MLADRSPIDSSKRQGIFHVTNLAFKVYFRLNSMRMCQTFISNIRTGGLDLDLFPISQQVTYKYYLGRYALYNGQLKKAQDCLLFAFQKCHIGHWHNKRVILHYLIPTRIILGHFPSLQLLETYELTAPYADLLKALRSGHLKGYLQHLETYFDYFYSHLTYLLLKERGIVLVWRCLIKNMYHQKQKLNQTIPVIEFRDCLKAFYFASPTGTSYTVEDMECILVSLVSQNYIRGYLQHSKQRLVLSKVNAFPPISHVRVHVERYNEAVLEDHMMHAQPPLPEEIQAYIDHE
ncbi:uncharacterized protein EV154DRAFT_78518 [Mucor mucedo]|uniref:uncharacterized protein n=1 Tax=Mucor mucedo TaxID=29922 RepID=UPI0022212772|nr:uncharacterized protein EV154DRAFT_78518 [Mucor mucedo]KAI7874777.1 hypothetical protein EV154DRAFT_78518 [Mucor mucedo]